MCLCELTREQQIFAEDNHNLVYAFLREKKLRQDDYYDVVVFGYLRAVRQYCDRVDLRERYTFGTIAWRKMTDDLYNHYKMQSRPSRKAMTVSFEAMAYDDRLTWAEMIPGSDPMTERLDANLLWEEISDLLTAEQTDVLRMRANGYSPREIASMRRSPVREIEDLLSSALESARELCLV